MAKRSSFFGFAVNTIGAAVRAAVSYTYVIRPWHLRWGTIDDEAGMSRKMLLGIRQRAEHTAWRG